MRCFLYDTHEEEGHADTVHTTYQHHTHKSIDYSKLKTLFGAGSSFQLITPIPTLAQLNYYPKLNPSIRDTQTRALVHLLCYAFFSNLGFHFSTLSVAYSRIFLTSFSITLTRSLRDRFDASIDAQIVSGEFQAVQVAEAVRAAAPVRR